MTDELTERLIGRLQQAVFEGTPFARDPAWYFLILKNPEVLNGVIELSRSTCVNAELAVLGFAAWKPAAMADACAALHRMKEAADMNCGTVFSDEITLCFADPAHASMCDAFGIPSGYVCIGAFLISEGEKEEEGSGYEKQAGPRYNVFTVAA